MHHNVKEIQLPAVTKLKMVFLPIGHANPLQPDADSYKMVFKVFEVVYKTNKNPISEILKSGSLINR